MAAQCSENRSIPPPVADATSRASTQTSVPAAVAISSLGSITTAAVSATAKHAPTTTVSATAKQSTSTTVSQKPPAPSTSAPSKAAQASKPVLSMSSRYGPDLAFASGRDPSFDVPTPNTEKLRCYDSCRKFYSTYDSLFAHFVTSHCIDQRPLHPPLTDRHAFMEQCRQCQRIYKKGQVHKVTPCTVPVSVRKDFRHAYNAFQAFFAKYPFDELQQGAELPDLNELIKSHPNTLEKFPEILF